MYDVLDFDYDFVVDHYLERLEENDELTFVVCIFEGVLFYLRRERD